MRKHLVWILAVTMVISASAVAWARSTDTETSTASIKVSPSKLSKSKFKPIKLSIETTTLSNTNPGTPTNPGNQPGATKTVTLVFDNDIKFDTKGIPKCNGAKLNNTTPAQADAKCKSSTVGSGSAVACLGNPCTALSASVRAYNGKPIGGHPTLVLHSYISALNVTTVLTGVLKGGGKGDFNKVLKVPVPTLPAVITDFKTTVGGGSGKAKNYVTARCADKDKHLNLDSAFAYYDTNESPDADHQFATCKT